MIFTTRQQIVLASGNLGKIKEIQAILDRHPIIPQSELNVPEAAETGSTFVENAIVKARNASACAGLPAIADDSGLVVDALDGAPGVLSARYAGAGSSDQANLQKLLHDLDGVPEDRRSARFICVIVFMQHAGDPFPLIAQGVWEGRIIFSPAGGNGFGYDPVFWVPERGCSSAELPAHVKNSLSHRGRALAMLKEQIKAREN